MKALVAALLIFGSAIAASAPAQPFPAATPESQGMSAQALASLLAVARGFADKGDIVGGELLIIKNRRTVLHDAVGLGDLENKKPLRTGTIYCIRSMTKPLTGAAVQMLIDEGRLSYDDTAAKYLPAFDNDKARDITVRQLLTHTSGLPLSTLLTNNFQELSSLREVVDISGRKGPTIPPGSGFQYSDDGTDTLAAIVEMITGQSAETFIARRVLEPLGMSDTFPLARSAGPKRQRFTPAYAGSRGNWMRFASPSEAPLFNYFLASQSMYSTTQDYARFLAMYLDEGRAGGKRVLSEAAVRRTLEPANATGFPDGFSRETTYYGQLMMEYVDANRRLVAFGHGGSDGTFAYAWPDHDLMVLFFTQSRGTGVSVELEAAIDRLLLGGSAPAAASPPSAESMAPYLGTYWLEAQQKPMIVVLHNDRLALELPWQSLVELQPATDKDVWTFAAAPDTSVKFNRSGDAPASSLELRGKRVATLQRLEPEAGLPSVDELFQRRPDRDRARKLAALGTLRMTGSVQLTAGDQKGTFDMLAAGQDHARFTLAVGGQESLQVVAGKRAWARYASHLPAQEMPESLARATRLNGWLLATGDWRDEFAHTRVLKKVVVDGRPAFLVQAVPAQGRQRIVYLDAGNGLLLGYDEVQDLPGMGLVGSEVRFDDYRDIEGVQIPFKATVVFPTPMLGTFAYQAREVQTRVKVAKDPFTLDGAAR